MGAIEADRWSHGVGIPAAPLLILLSLTWTWDLALLLTRCRAHPTASTREAFSFQVWGPQEVLNIDVTAFPGSLAPRELVTFPEPAGSGQERNGASPRWGSPVSTVGTEVGSSGSYAVRLRRGPASEGPGVTLHLGSPAGFVTTPAFAGLKAPSTPRLW